MKNGKLPTRQQKILLKAHGYDPANWLIVKDFPNHLEVISRSELKKIGMKRLRTRTISKDL